MDWSYRRNFLWVSSPGLHTLSREKFVSCSHKYQGRVEFRILFKLLHTKQLNTALKTATSSRSRSIFSSNSWWEMCSSGNRTRSVRLVENTVPFNIRKFRIFGQMERAPGSLSVLITSTKTNHEPIAAQVFVHVT